MTITQPPPIGPENTPGHFAHHQWLQELGTYAFTAQATGTAPNAAQTNLTLANPQGMTAWLQGGKVVIPTAGLWRFHVTGTTPFTAAGTSFLTVRRGANERVAAVRQTVSAADVGLDPQLVYSLSGSVPLAAGDALFVQVYQNSGSPVTCTFQFTVALDARL